METTYKIAKFPEESPTECGRYHIIRKDGKEHIEVWNNTGWAYNHNEVAGWLKPNKWYSQSEKPPYNGDDRVMMTSVQVLLYSPKLKLYSIGWFDYETNKWFNMYDDTDVNWSDFVWTYPPKY